MSVFALTSHFFLDTHKKPTLYQHRPVHLSFSHHPSIFADTFSVLKILNRPGKQYLRSANSTSKGGQSHSEKKSMGRKAARFILIGGIQGIQTADTKAVYRFDWFNHKHGTHLGDFRPRSHCKPPSEKKERKKMVTLFRSISLIGVLYRADSCPFRFTAWTLPVGPPMFYSSELTF